MYLLLFIYRLIRLFYKAKLYVIQHETTSVKYYLFTDQLENVKRSMVGIRCVRIKSFYRRVGIEMISVNVKYSVGKKRKNVLLKKKIIINSNNNNNFRLQKKNTEQLNRLRVFRKG